MSSGRLLVEKLGFAVSAEQIYWAYDGQEFTHRTSPTQTFTERPVFGCLQKPNSIKEEGFRAARLISEKHKVPCLMLSGGIDSEVMALNFFLQGLPFKVVILDYNGQNEHDIFRAKKFCDNLGIKYSLLRFDVLKFWENDLQQLAAQANTSSPQIAALCYAVSQIDEPVIVGDGEPSLRGYDKKFFDSKCERWALARWMHLIEKPGCPRFYQFTPELESSYYFDPVVEQFVGGAWEFFDFKNLIYLKPFLMNKYYNCELRPKLNGFELLKPCEDYRNLLKKSIVETQLSWTYEDARNWVFRANPPLNTISVQDSDLNPKEKEALLQNDIHRHVIIRE